jgi:hypothetical protein
MTAALRLRRLAPGLVTALFLAQATVASARQSGHDAKPSVAPAKPSITPPRMSQQDVTKPAAGHEREAPPQHAKAAEHSKPAGNAKPATSAKAAEPGTTAETTKTAPPAKAAPNTKAPAHGQSVEPVKTAEAAPAQQEDTKEAGMTRATRHLVTPGPARRKSAERAVAALGAALSARRERVTRHEAAAPPPPPPPAPVRRLASRRRAPLPRPPPPPRYEVPWPSRIVDVHWPGPLEHRAVAWPSERPEPIELRWDLKALQSDLSEPTAAIGR